jgi:hypothetical protein
LAAVIHPLKCGCGCQSEELFKECSWLDFELQVIDLMLQSLTEKDDNEDEPGTDAFASVESGLAARWASAIRDRGEAVRRYLAEALGANASTQRITVALQHMDETMSHTFDDVADITDWSLAEAINTGIIAHPAAVLIGTNGASLIAGRGTILEATQSVAHFHEGLVAAAKYSTNNFFNTQVIPAVEREVEKLFNNAQPNLSPILNVLDNRLRSVPYWNVVANAAASRAYHYGYAKAAEALGYTYYEFVAVMDKRTSEICRHMNGKKFTVSAAVDIMQRSADAESPEDLKQIQPWITVDQAKSMDTEALKNNGVLIPPLHGSCRSTIKVI